MAARIESISSCAYSVEALSAVAENSPELEQRVLRAAMATSDGWWEWQLASEHGWYSDDFARLLGYDPADLAPSALTFANLIHPADQQRVMREIDAHIVGGAPFNVQFRMRHSSGTYRWVRSRGRCTYDDSGTPLLLSGSLQDIALHKLAALQDYSHAQVIARQERMNSLNTMAAGVAHEFNNLLQVMQGYLQCATRQVELQRDPRRDLAQAQGAVDRAIRLNREFLAFCRTGESTTSPIDLNNTLRALAERLDPVLPPGIVLSIQGASEPLLVEVDEGALHEALLNLATNARDAMNSSGELAIRCYPLEVGPANAALFPELAGGHYACLAVTDTGEGIDPEVAHRVWEPFFTTKPPHLGSGLGLAQVYGFARQHRGAVGLHSEPGRGTTFRIYLSLANPTPPGAPQPDLSDWQQRPALLLTPDPLLASAVQRIVEEHGGKVVAMDSPQLLWRTLEHDSAKAPLWVLLDWDEPERLAAEIKQRAPGAQVACFSGFDVESPLSAARLVGRPGTPWAAVLEKPFDARALWSGLAIH